MSIAASGLQQFDPAVHLRATRTEADHARLAAALPKGYLGRSPLDLWLLELLVAIRVVICVGRIVPS